MECLHCKGEMERSTAPFTVDRHGYHVRWDAIPAWVCTQCGRPFFEEHEVEEIQRALEALDRANDRLATAV
jgi:YgiT-type zinc finger domain-containing protein